MTESIQKPVTAQLNYQGYHLRQRGDSDELLVRVNKGSACGEYLRRYWQPIALTSEIEDVPKLVTVMGETLVLFRDKSGRFGLVHKQCPHRRASMEFGVCDERGIRCCYHGWLFDIDGSILEIPGQPDGSAEIIKSKTALGAYPLREYRGLIFAYLGPIEEIPEFPVYDTFNIPGQTMVPYRADYNCNWIQVLDAILDPIHTSFLHSRMSRPQFSEGMGELGELQFFQRPMSFLGASTRRVGDNIWVRANELVLPNFTQAGAAFSADGHKQIHYGRTAFVRWVVPVDDENTTAFAWAVFGERADPHEYNTPEGPELIEQGEVMDRSYQQRQRFPGDAEAVEGMGQIADQKMEHLAPSDQGIIQYRKKLRKLCRDLQTGIQPEHSTQFWASTVPTYGGDTVLKIPPDDNDDSTLLREIGERVMHIQFEAESLPTPQRDEQIVDALKQLENEYARS